MRGDGDRMEGQVLVPDELSLPSLRDLLLMVISWGGYSNIALDFLFGIVDL